MKSYKLVNPYVANLFSNDFTAENGLDASKMAWQKLSEIFDKPTKKLSILLEDETGYLHPYLIKEKYVRNKQNEKVIKFSIFEITNKINPEGAKQFKNELKKNLDKLGQQGGKHHHHHHFDEDDDEKEDSSSSSSSAYYYPNGPVLFYNVNTSNFATLWQPFAYPFVPYGYFGPHLFYLKLN